MEPNISNNQINNNNDVNNINNNFDVGNISNNNFNNNVRSDSSEEDFETVEETEVSSDDASAQALVDRISSYRKKLCDMCKSNYKNLSDEEAKEKVLLAFNDNDLEVLSQVEDLLYPLQEKDKNYLLNLFYEFSSVFGHGEFKVDKGNFHPYRVNFLSRVVPEFNKNEEVENFLSKNDQEYKLIDVILDRAEKPKEVLSWFLDKDFRNLVSESPLALRKLIAIYNTKGMSGPKILAQIKSSFKANYKMDINVDEMRAFLNFDFERFITEGEIGNLIPFKFPSMKDKKMKTRILGEYYYNALNSYLLHRDKFYDKETRLENKVDFAPFYLLPCNDDYVLSVLTQCSSASLCYIEDNNGNKETLGNMIKSSFLLVARNIEKITSELQKKKEIGFDDIANVIADVLKLKIYNKNSQGEQYIKFEGEAGSEEREIIEHCFGNEMKMPIDFINFLQYPYFIYNKLKHISLKFEDKFALYNILLSPEEINYLSISDEYDLKDFINRLVDFVKINLEYRGQLKSIAMNLDFNSENVKKLVSELKPFTEIELTKEYVVSERRKLLPKNVPNMDDDFLARIDNKTLSDVSKLKHLISNFEAVKGGNFKISDVPYGLMRLILQQPDCIFAVSDILPEKKDYISINNEAREYLITNIDTFLPYIFAFKPDLAFDLVIDCMIRGNVSPYSAVDTMLKVIDSMSKRQGEVKRLSDDNFIKLAPKDFEEKILSDDNFIKLAQVAPKDFEEKILSAIEKRMKDNPEFKKRADNLANTNKIVKSGGWWPFDFFTKEDYLKALKCEETGLVAELPSQNDVSAIDAALNQKFPQGLNPEVRNTLKDDYRMVLNWKIDDRIMKLLGNEESTKKLITICKAQHIQPTQFLQIVDKLNGGSNVGDARLTSLLKFDFNSILNLVKDNYPDMNGLKEKERSLFLSEIYMNAIKCYCNSGCPDLSDDSNVASWFYLNDSNGGGVGVLDSMEAAWLFDIARDYKKIIDSIDKSKADQDTIINELKKTYPNANEDEISTKNSAIRAISNSINIYKTNLNLSILAVISNPEFIADVDFNTISPTEFAYMLTFKLDSIHQQGRLYEVLACLDLSSDVAQALLNNINNISYGIKKKEIIRVKKEKYSSNLDRVKPSTMRAIQDNIFEVMSLADMRSEKCRDILKFFGSIKNEIDTMPAWFLSKTKMFVSGHPDQARNNDMLAVFNANASELDSNSVNNFIKSIEGEADFRLEFLIFQKPDFIVPFIGQLNKAAEVQINQDKKINFAKYLLNALSYVSKHPQFTSTKFREVYKDKEHKPDPRAAISAIIDKLSSELLQKISKQNLTEPAKKMVNDRLEKLEKENIAQKTNVPPMESIDDINQNIN